MADWDFSTPIDYHSDALIEIVKFFVFETPVNGTSTRGRSFEERGIKGNHIKKIYEEIKDQLPDFYQYWETDIIDNLPDRYAGEGIWESVDFSFEFAYHYVKEGLNQATALYYMIRCAFAHGCFSIHDNNGEIYYMFENFHDNQSKGRAVLKESTLFTLRDIIDLVEQRVVDSKNKTKA